MPTRPPTSSGRRTGGTLWVLFEALRAGEYCYALNTRRMEPSGQPRIVKEATIAAA